MTGSDALSSGADRAAGRTQGTDSSGALPREADTTGAVPAVPDGVTAVAERAAGENLYQLEGWALEMPWLVQGITGSAADMSLFGDAPVGEQISRWSALRDRLECAAIVHARQVHEATVHLHDVVTPGVLIASDADGHATSRAGVLLAVTAADCVPIYLAAPDVRAVALLHGGWRGIAAGMLETGMDALVRRFGADAGELRVHLGPAICGDCYQVGPEVPAGLGLDPTGGVTGSAVAVDGAAGSHPGGSEAMRAGRRAHVDLRAAIAQRAVAAGVPADHITISAFCTRHGDSPFFSHRGGSAERQLAVLAIRRGAAGHGATPLRHDPE